MTLSEIDECFYSHPNYPFKNHVNNIEKCFADDLRHKKSAQFHDLGKLSNVFQSYIKKESDTKTTHSLESALIYYLLGKEELDESFISVFYAILSHHGRLKNLSAVLHLLGNDEKIIADYRGIEKRINEILQILGLKKEINIEEISEFFYNNEEKIKESFCNFKNYFKIKEVFSKLIFADKYEAIFKDFFKPEGFKNLSAYLNNLLDIIKNKSKNNHLSQIRNQAREEVLDNFSKNNEKSIFLIEAPTGLGKTFMSFHLAFEIAALKKKDKIITVLPMTSIIDQTYDELSAICSMEDLLKFHYLSDLKQYSQSYNFKNEDLKAQKLTNQQKHEFLSLSWAFDKVIVSTFNQILNCFYSNSNKDLIKFHNLENSVIIFDEIQAIPRVLLKDFSYTIAYLSKNFHIDFILMSATVPEIQEYFETDIKVELLDTKYFFMDFNNKYTLSFNKELKDVQTLKDAIITCKEDSVLAVVNTKKVALELYYEIEKSIQKEELFLLSGNFIPLHRKEIIKTIKSRLLKNQKTILISTQVIEAGVDLDFQKGFREFAPFCNIIQSAGRVNREAKRDNAEIILCNKISKYSPYHSKDVDYEEMTKALENPVEAKNLLPILRDYFKRVQKKTRIEPLLYDKMKNLQFDDVYEIFSKNFMPSNPNLTPVFIETEINLRNKLKEKRDKLLEIIKSSSSLEEKMNIKVQLKSINKKASQYIIQVPKKEVDGLPVLWDLDATEFSIYYCPFDEIGDKKKYSLKKGWNFLNEDFIW